MRRNILLFCIVILSNITGFAQKSIVDYNDLKKEYSHFPENDPQALPYITGSIASAKRSTDVLHLLHAYEDGAFSSPRPLEKLKYADSCIQTAQKTKDPSLISMAYLGKGIVYYFNFRKYDQALALYLIAAKSAAQTNNDYLKFKIKYQIGVVKSYLRYSEDAMIYFEESLFFFETNLKKELHPHLRYNNMRGYLNTLHQMSICDRNLHRYDQAQERLLRMKPYITEPTFTQEKGYYLKESGILDFQHGKFPEAIEGLLHAEKLLQYRKEEGYLSTAYFYLGNAYLKINERERAFFYLKKVDSLFTGNETVLPEVLKTYELLLKTKNFPVTSEDRTFYIDQLLKADHILQTEMPHLSSKIHFEYDTQILRNEKEKLQKGNEKLNTIQTLLITLGGAGLIFILLLIMRNQNILANYRLLQKKLADNNSSVFLAEPSDQNRRMTYADEIVEELLEKLKKFEKSTLFTDPDVTLEKLAKLLETNKNHLSYVLNEHRKTNFHNYIASLRIHYITNLMNTDREYLKYTSDTLADSCGIKHRQHFSKLFYRYNKIRPSDFIEQKKKELNMP